MTRVPTETDIIPNTFHVLATVPDHNHECEILALGPRAFERQALKPCVGDIVEYIGDSVPFSRVYKIEDRAAIIGIDVFFKPMVRA